MTPDPLEAKAWSACPTCRAFRELECRSWGTVRVSDPDDASQYIEGPCPTCEAFHAALAELKRRCMMRVCPYCRLTDDEYPAAVMMDGGWVHLVNTEMDGCVRGREEPCRAYPIRTLPLVPS